mmetsp:Transcript_20899/g.23296  ORF Transcript_20899/g.23296 Transcript_20899/m.23296 type:complete len:139 (-) Transcript_20899:917-1333(-)
MAFNTDKEIFRGLAVKKGGATRRNWTKREFVLTENHVTYYALKGSRRSLKGRIPIASVVRAILKEERKKYQLFNIVTLYRVYHVRTCTYYNVGCDFKATTAKRKAVYQTKCLQTYSTCSKRSGVHLKDRTTLREIISR